MLDFVICDDNLNILNKLSSMLTNIFTKNDYSAKVSYISYNVNNILNYIKSNKTDVLFLDINLKSDISGLELAKEVRKINKHIYIIFTTAHLEYAMIAYKVKTFDYIAKPITLDRLEDTVKRLFDDINEMPKRYIKIDNKNTIIDESEIIFIKRDGMKVIFVTSSRDYETYSSFNKITNLLPDNFIRCHKSYISNIYKIKDVEPVTNTITFSNDFSCSIGPKYKKSLLEVLRKNGNFK